MTRVKICGITCLEDAIVAADAGADYLGFIFYPPSKRFVEKSVVAEISAELRKRDSCPQLVGVFVNDSAETILQTLNDCNLDLAQLSGDELPSLAGDPKSILFGRAFKAIRPQSAEEAQADSGWFSVDTARNQFKNPHLPTILIDAYHPDYYGGSGRVGDWTIAAQSEASHLMLAGGLTPENVENAILTTLPFAVDVAGGVEAGPGRKNHNAVRRFITNAKH